MESIWMATPSIRFPFPNSLQDTSYTILLDWWTALEADKGERAELKRAEHPLRVAFSPAYHNLLRRLQEAGYHLGIDSRERLAVLAGLAAHVKQHTDNGRSFAAQMGSPRLGSDKAVVFELRFRRILALDSLDELYTQLRRAVSLLDGTANLVDLARVLFRWRSIAEQNPFDPRKDWAYDYYAAAPRP
jgi:CRISPR system Cascade subunit CasB